ncbi:MAG: hypothetical protein OXI92_03915 [Acidobacteriota bacterium]|nr:hypothetical protein [Acidobacteriota bacterium]
MQWKRIGVIALSVVLVAAPASAIPVVDPVAKLQRIIMMTNQLTVITNQLTQIQQFTDKLSEMRDQVQHLKDKALGAYHSLTSPFTSLISAKTELVGTGMSWASQFQGTAAQLANTYRELSNGVSVRGGWDGLLQTADTVSESDLVTLLSGLPPAVVTQAAEDYRSERAAADRMRVLDHTLADASSTLIESLKAAQDALDRVRNQTEKSDTALAQAHITATATQAELMAALAQLQAYQSAREAGKSYEAELSRRRQLDIWAETVRQSEAEHQTAMTAIQLMPDTHGREVQFSIHPHYR